MEAKKNILTYAGLKKLEEELHELKKPESRVTYPRMRNMMQQKMNSVILKHVSKKSKKS